MVKLGEEGLSLKVISGIYIKGEVTAAKSVCGEGQGVAVPVEM